MRKTRDRSRCEAIDLAGLIRQMIRLSGFVLMVDLNRKYMVLKDTANNEEFAFSAGGEILDE